MAGELQETSKRAILRVVAQQDVCLISPFSRSIFRSPLLSRALFRSLWLSFAPPPQSLQQN